MGYHQEQKWANTEKDAYNEGSITFKSTLKNDENTNKVTFVFRDSSSKYEYDNWDQTDNHDFSKQIFNQV